MRLASCANNLSFLSSRSLAWLRATPTSSTHFSRLATLPLQSTYWASAHQPASLLHGAIIRSIACRGLHFFLNSNLSYAAKTGCMSCGHYFIAKAVTDLDKHHRLVFFTGATTALKFMAKMTSNYPILISFTTVIWTTAKYCYWATHLQLQLAMAALWRCRLRRAFLGISVLAFATFT